MPKTQNTTVILEYNNEDFISRAIFLLVFPRAIAEMNYAVYLGNCVFDFSLNWRKSRTVSG